MKLCSKCGKEKPITEFNKNKNAKDGHAAWCSVCNREYMKRYNEENKEKHKEYLKEYNEKNKEQKQKYNQEYYLKNRDKLLTHQKEYDAINHEHKLEYMRGYGVKNRERISEYNKVYQKEYYAKNEDKVKARKAIYNRTEKCKFIQKTKSYRRRAQKKKTKEEDRIILKQWHNIIQNQNNRCNVCGCKFSVDIIPTLDHIIPLSKGGMNSSDNIQALCGSCNSRKNNALDMNYIQMWIMETV